MPIYKPTELHQFLDQLGISPQKRLSQNFLIDGNIIRKIVALSRVDKEDTILEIGPGPGSLTEALLATGASVIAVEKDRILADALKRLILDPPQLKIFCHDIMTFPLKEQLDEFSKAGKKIKVIANLPYHLTTPILALLSPMRDTISSLTVMVQEEVARRMTALPGTSDYSSFSVFLRFYTNPFYGFNVSRNCFYPIPKVDSAVVMLELRNPPLSEDQAISFFELTRTAFEHRRKMLRASLKELYPPSMIEKSLLAIGENPLARPETLSLEAFLALHARLSAHHTDKPD